MPVASLFSPWNLVCTDGPLGFGFVNEDNVYKVCDQPHPATVQNIIAFCQQGLIREAQKEMNFGLIAKGYAPIDIIGTMFKVVKNADLQEFIKLEFLKEIGFAHKAALEGCDSVLQVSGLLARLCNVRNKKIAK